MHADKQVDLGAAFTTADCSLREGGEGGVPNPVKRLKMTQIPVTLGSKPLNAKKWPKFPSR